MTGTGNNVAVHRLPRSEPIEGAPCPVCAARRATPTFDIEGYPLSIVVCAGCGTGRMDPFPRPEELAAFYPSSYYGGGGRKFTPVVERLVRTMASRKARGLSRGFATGGRVLDIGCGRGTLLGDLADLGYEAHGVEVSEAAAVGADSRAEIRIAWTLAEAGYDADSFDLVILWHVLEHLLDPVDTLREIARVLRPGGRLSLAVPNFSSWQARATSAAWFHLDPPRHLFHFPLAALRSLLADCGFEAESVSHFSLRQNPFGWVQSALNLSRGLPRNALYSTLQNADEIGVSTGQRLACLVAFALGMPVGLVLSALATLARSGATVGLNARSPV